ncbi:alpha/beta fold hydrolase [Rugamonas aquatica]|nr:alpha/beta hydrolase [Rugamonas aquatica]
MIYTVISVAAALLAAVLLFERVAPVAAARLGMALERRRAGLRLRQAALPGCSMPYLEGGSGDVLVLVHGFGGDKDNFTRIARFLTPRYRVLIPDLPGFGDASRDPQAGYAIADQVERLRAFLDRHAPGRVHLGGNSMGGYIAAQFAAGHPERVASLWLLDAAGTEAAQSSAALAGYRATGAMPLLVPQERDFAQLIASSSHRAFFLPYSVRTALARRAVADFALHTAIMRQVTASPLLERQFNALRTPALIVWGEEDLILHPSGAAALAALFGDHRVILMPGIGHLPMLEAPRRSAHDYFAFRRRLAQAADIAPAAGAQPAADALLTEPR